MVNYEIRKQWDKVMQDHVIVQHNPEDNSDIIYNSVKPPVFFISKRDFVQKRKIWKGVLCPDSILIHSTKTEHPSYPEKSNPVRGQIILGGVYLKTLSINPHKVLYCTVSQNDLRGNITAAMINDSVPKRSKEMVKNFVAGLNQVYRGKK